MGKTNRYRVRVEKLRARAYAATGLVYTNAHIARELKVSREAVSQAVNGAPSMYSLRERILLLLEKMAGTQLTNKQTKKGVGCAEGYIDGEGLCRSDIGLRRIKTLPSRSP